jgi:CheY-like chemotaxis protein
MARAPVVLMRAGPVRILVADDDPDLLRTVARSLERSGAQVTCATNGADLMSHLGDDRPFDLVVADISMPWMTGLQAMHSVKYAGLGTPTIIMTALQDAGIAEQVKALGGNTVLLRKPFGLEDLKAAVTGLLS